MKNEKYLIYNFSGEIDDISSLFPNERLAQLGAIIKKHGKDIRIWDRTNLRDIFNTGKQNLMELGKLNFYDSSEMYQKMVDIEVYRLLEEGFSCIFFNFWHGTGFKFSADLIKKIKQLNPEITIFGIGQKVDWFNESIFTAIPQIDAIIRGLGHSSIEMIIENRRLDEIPNLILKTNKGIKFTNQSVVDPSAFPCADFSEDLYSNINFKIPLYEISLSNQACPNKCAFCVRPSNYGKKLIRINPEKAVSEMIDLYKNKGIRNFRFSDSTPPKGALTEFSREIIKQGFHKADLFISAFSRTDVNKEEDFALMKKAGIRSLFFGIESLDEDTLRKNSKGTNILQIKDTVKKAHQNGIFTVGSFIFPFPGETERSMMNTLENIKDMKNYLDSVLIMPGGVYPVTEWGKNPEKFSIILEKDYLEKMTTYPIKYLVPMKHWPELPFSYDLMGKKAENVTFKDIVEINSKFTDIVRNDIKIPGVPDYYFSISEKLGKKPDEFTNECIQAMIDRNIEYFENLRLKM